MTRWRAKYDEDYWWWDSIRKKAQQEKALFIGLDSERYEFGNYFRTKEECEHKGPRMQAIADEEWIQPRWKPVLGESFWYVTSDMGKNSTVMAPSYPPDDAKVENGNCFKTKEEAEEAREVLLHALDEFWKSKGVRGRD